jgi:hypothetical protein
VQMSCGVERKSMRTLCTVQDRTALLDFSSQNGRRPISPDHPLKRSGNERCHHRHNSVR